MTGLHLILQEAHGAGGQKPLVAVLDGERQVLEKQLQVSLFTHSTATHHHQQHHHQKRGSTALCPQLTHSIR